MDKKLFFVLGFIFFNMLTFSQGSDNPELKQMYAQDQNDRKQLNPDVDKNDSIRLKRIYELLSQGKVVTGKDYYRSALIFQHGEDSVSYKMAVKLMRKAIELDSTISRWLLAAATDRYLLSIGKPQIYGTQFGKFNDSKWVRRRIDTTQITDKERIFYGVETLSEQREKERRMNLKQIVDYYKPNGDINEIAEFLRLELNKGLKSEYDVSDNSIAELGYMILSSKKSDNALQIFKLNTELFPNNYKVFDYYGECLLLLNRIDEGKVAYKKSLELNPNSLNAKRALSKLQ